MAIIGLVDMPSIIAGVIYQCRLFEGRPTNDEVRRFHIYLTIIWLSSGFHSKSKERRETKEKKALAIKEAVCDESIDTSTPTSVARLLFSKCLASNMNKHFFTHSKLQWLNDLHRERERISVLKNRCKHRQAWIYRIYMVQISIERPLPNPLSLDGLEKGKIQSDRSEMIQGSRFYFFVQMHTTRVWCLNNISQETVLMKFFLIVAYL